MERLLRRSGLLLVLLLLLCFLRSRLPLRRFSLRDRVRSLLLVRLDFFGEGDRDRDKTGWLCDLSDEREREGSGDDVTLQIFSDLRRELPNSNFGRTNLKEERGTGSVFHFRLSLLRLSVVTSVGPIFSFFSTS